MGTDMVRKNTREEEYTEVDIHSKRESQHKDKTYTIG